MKTIEAVMVSTAFWTAIGVLGAPDVMAQTCRPGCRGETKACMESVRADRIDCRLACRDDAYVEHRGSCLRECLGTYRTDRHACRDGATTCAIGCRDPQRPDAHRSCRGECGIGLGECVRNAARGRPACIMGCPTGPDRRECTEDCVAATSPGLDDCLTEFAECRADCDDVVPTSTSSTTSTITSTSTTTSTAPAAAAILEFVTHPAAGICGEARTGGAGGPVVKTLTCGGLNLGGGCFEDGASCGVPEGPTPGGASIQLNATCDATTCALGARTAAETGTQSNCSNTGCQFGTWLSIANGGTSVCVLNTFSSPGSGSLDLVTGSFHGSFPLTTAVTITGNGASPCPPCVDGACASWAANPGASCVSLNVYGDSYECLPGEAGIALPPFAVDLTPISTSTEVMDSTAGDPGIFCPGQDDVEPGSRGCFVTNFAGVCDYIEARGSEAGPISVGSGPTDATLASVFCIPAAGNALIDGVADLPGPGELTLPGTLELIAAPWS